jgi:glycosyltransferase involved in cell wall biosynthesis
MFTACMPNETSTAAGSEPAPQLTSTGPRLRVLAIDEEVPFPANTGKRIRTWNLLKRLAARHDITLLCYGRERGREFDVVRQCGIQLRLVDPLPELSGLPLYWRLLLNLISSYPYSVEKHYTQRFQSKVDELLGSGEFDLLHCEWTPYARYRTGQVQVPSILATHNIESQIWERRADNAGGALARLFFRMQARKMAAFERKNLPCLSVVTAVSPEDAHQTADWTQRNCALVENGVDLDQFRPSSAGCFSELLFLGSLDWFPNRDAVEYMVQEILPLIRTATPIATLRVVGRRPPKDFVRRIAEVPGVEVLGEVDDVRPYLERAGVIVVPLRIGGGSRIKILEALATSKAVVSTSVGAEGLAVQDGHNILLADNPQDFAARVQQLMGSEEDRSRLGKNGRDLVEQRYSWDDCAAALEAAWYRAHDLHSGGSRG